MTEKAGRGEGETHPFIKKNAVRGTLLRRKRICFENYAYLCTVDKAETTQRINKLSIYSKTLLLMPVVYQSYQSQIANKAGKRLFYPRVILTGRVGTNQIAREIAELSSLTTGDVKNVIDNLVTVVSRHLQASESVSLDGFGSFRLTLNTLNGGVENEADVSASQSQLMVRFQSASTRKSDGTLATRTLVDGAKCVRFEAVPVDPVDPEPGTGEDDDDSGQGTFG